MGVRRRTGLRRLTALLLSCTLLIASLAAVPYREVKADTYSTATTADDTSGTSAADSAAGGSAATDAAASGTPAADTTYEYSFSEFAPYDQDHPIDSAWTADGLVELHGGSKMYYHDTTHGLAVFDGNSLDVKVAGNAYITFELCQYASGSITVSGGADNGQFSADSFDLAAATDGEKVRVAYKGDAATLTFTVHADGQSYLHGFKTENTSEDIDLKSWAQKSFSFKLGELPIVVAGAPSSSDSAALTLGSGTESGSVYYASAESAMISVDLKGSRLASSLLTNDSPETVSALSVDETTGEIVAAFADSSTYPSEFRIKVQDRGAFIEPNPTGVYTYDFGSGAVPSDLNKSRPVVDSYTTDDGLLTVARGDGSSSPYWHDSSHGLALYGGNKIEVQVAGDAEIAFELCEYSKDGGTLEVSNLAEGGSGSFDSNSFKAAVDGDSITYSYSGDATTLRFALSGGTGESYLHAVTVKNNGTLTGSPILSEQASMPAETDPNDALTVTPHGHRLLVDHADDSANISTMSHLGYYLFDGIEGAAAIEADIRIQSVGNTSNNGVFFGMFDDSDAVSRIATVGVRGNKSIRNVYSKDSSPDSPSAGSLNIPFQIGDVVHIVNRKTDTGWESEVTLNKETSNASIEYGKIAMIDDVQTRVKYGFAFANVSAVIQNLSFTDADGHVLYDQNAAYEAIGTAPTAQSLEAPEVSEDRTQITLRWNGDTPAEDSDGAYVVEMSADGGATYAILADQVKETSYVVSIEGSGDYRFRVYGVCGDEKTAALESDPVQVLAPLAAPTLGIVSGDGYLELNWNAAEKATRYDLYRKSSEEDDYSLLAEGVTELSYRDNQVVNETPYYYYIVARSDTNSSNGSVPILSVPSAGHTGDYVYEDEAADLFLTKKSYDTVYADHATLEGVVNKKGTLRLIVNDEDQAQATLGVDGSFSFSAELVEGRNDVNLLFTDEDGKVTRRSFNFVYLTNYDIVVDASYSGDPGAESPEQPGVKLFSTVQAAVDSVPSDQQERIVVLLKEGSYDEHLRVASPNITLIGEDRDRVNIHFYDPVESPEGGSTSDRNAVYIQKTATGFAAENLTFENTYVYLGDGTKSNESADALRVDADQSTFVNVKLVGYQDTLYASSNRQYYYKSYILGNVDFIYGGAQALFDDSDVVFRYNSGKNSGYVTAPNTTADAKYGYIFNRSRITAEAGASGSKYLLARPWGPDGAATFIRTYMSGIVNKEAPYADMSGNLAVNARFDEYYTYGDGFSIHSGRPQLSQAQADQMLTPSYLGWNPYETIQTRAVGDYVGDIVTTADEKFIEQTYVRETADPNASNDTGLGRYKLEGYASVQGVTGGGLLLETAAHYHKAATADEFLSALSNARSTGRPTVIELTDDIALGSLEIGDALTAYGDIIQPANHQPLLHPTLLQTGVSTLKLTGMSNLTIFSRNGAKITHTTMEINGSSNIILRNLTFDELWEWDEDTGGDYDRNDWDYMTIQLGSTGIWIDHCTFYKAYDGIVDVKKADSTAPTDVTVSWSRFLPGSEGSFFDDMMDLLEANPADYPYYNELLTAHGMSKEQIREYAHGQKKTHLVGASDTEPNTDRLRLTLANNVYKDSMDRMPRLRSGDGHVYNTIMDASDLYHLRQSITDEDAQKKVVSNGAISTVGASVLVENSNIHGIANALMSGNGSSPGGYIGAIHTTYDIGGVVTELAVTDYTQQGLVMDVDAFKQKLPYEYQLYDEFALERLVQPFAGAGKLQMSTVQWEKTAYNDSSDPTNVGSPNTGTPNSGSGGISGDAEDEDGTATSAETAKQAIAGLPEAERRQVARNVEDYLPYTWNAKKGLTVAQLRALTGDRFTDEELAAIAANPETSLRELGIDPAGLYQESELTPMDDPHFADVDASHWAGESIRTAAKLGLVKGTADGDFAPGQPLQVADSFTFLDRLFLLHETTGGTLPRSTVELYVSKMPSWAYYHVASVASRLSEDTLRTISELGDRTISRELLAQVIYEATGGKLTPTREASAFSDLGSSKYRDAIDYCVRAGLLNGTSEKAMSPGKALTRAEMAAILGRLDSLLE